MAVPNLNNIVQTVLINKSEGFRTSECFESFKIKPEITVALKRMGIRKTSLIQSKSLHKLTNGNSNVAIICGTGTGKTLTALLAAVNFVKESECNVQVLYVCACLEAAVQSERLIQQIATFTPVKVTLVAKGETVCVGQKLNDHILVGTPKEISAYTMMRQFDIEKVKLCIFDDADEIMTTNIVKTNILNRLRNCKMVFLSATSLRSVSTCDIIRYELPLKYTQFYIKTGNDITLKFDAVLDVYKNLMKCGSKAIVFCSTRQCLDIVSDILSLKRCDIVKIDASFETDERIKLLDLFGSEKMPMAICTDVWNRAIDIPSVKVIINFDLPVHATRKTLDKKRYVYRMGRAGRFGRPAVAITLVDDNQEYLLAELREFQSIKMLNYFQSSVLPFKRTSARQAVVSNSNTTVGADSTTELVSFHGVALPNITTKIHESQPIEKLNHSQSSDIIIEGISARQFFDLNGNPIIKIELKTKLGFFCVTIPSDASKVLKLCDNDFDNYHGKSVQTVVDNINEVLAPELIKTGLEVTQQTQIDEFLNKLNGTENKSRYGTNTLLGISIAVAKAAAVKKSVPLYKHLADLADNKDIILPVPAFNVISGGNQVGSKLSMREFMILPTGATSFTEAMKIGSEVYHHLKKENDTKFGLDATAVDDGSDLAPKILNNKDALNLIQDAIAMAGYTGKVEISVNVSASEFYKNGLYKFHHDDSSAWSNFTANTKIQIVRSDLSVKNHLTVENPHRMATTADYNCFLLKINQFGTVTDLIKAHLLAKGNGWDTMVSYRDDEIDDNFTAAFVVGLSIGKIKTSARRSGHLSEIFRIEESLGTDAKYADNNFHKQ